MGCPKLIMIDEPTEGLSPQMVGNVEKLLKKIAEKGISSCTFGNHYDYHCQKKLIR